MISFYEAVIERILVERMSQSRLEKHKMEEAADLRRNKTAVALSYDGGDEAPKIIASGKGYLAEKMIEVAKETKVPIHKDEKLASTLSKLEIGDCIPPELYQVVAEVLIFVDKMDQMKAKLNGGNGYFKPV